MFTWQSTDDDIRKSPKEPFRLEPPPLFTNRTGIRTLSFSELSQRTSPMPEVKQEADPWQLPNLQQHGIGFSELNWSRKVRRVMVVIFKLFLIIIFLYGFICSLDLLSAGFTLAGGPVIKSIIKRSELLQNPIVGLMIGVLVTVIVQSSSTSTSIAVTMVASDSINVRTAIPLVMGANIGTSFTNTMVSLTQATDRNEFRRAFAAATVHDMFNWLTVIVLLPIEVTFRYLERLTGWLVNLRDWKSKEHSEPQFLQRITKPISRLIVEINAPTSNTTATLKTNSKSLMNVTGLHPLTAGAILAVVSVILLCICLILIVKVLNSMLKGQLLHLLKKHINTQLNFPWSYLAGYVAILVGCGMTILVQSSSIFTSALTPLAGLGVISLESVYPLTLGSNIGTTTTGILAAMAAKSSTLKESLQLAFCHMFFNITGTLIFYPIPFLRLPVVFARKLGNTTARYRWFSILYLLVGFILLPLTVFLLSLAGRLLIYIILAMVILISVPILILNALQEKCSTQLPKKLQNWNWLPLWMHSLDPLDGLVIWLTEKLAWCACCFQPVSKHDGLSGEPPPVTQGQFQESTAAPMASIPGLLQAYNNVAFIRIDTALSVEN